MNGKEREVSLLRFENSPDGNDERELESRRKKEDDEIRVRRK